MSNRTLAEHIETLNRVRRMLLHFRSTAQADRPLIDGTLLELDDVEAIVRDAYPAEEPVDDEPAGDESVAEVTTAEEAQ